MDDRDIVALWLAIIGTGDCNSCKNKYCEWKPEPGQRVPSGPLLFKIARVLRCTVEDLMQGVFCEPCPKITKEE